MLKIKIITIVLTMFALLAAGAFYAFDVATVDLESVVEGAMERKRPVDVLVGELGQARLEVHYVLLTGESAENGKLSAISVSLEDAFDEVIASKKLAEEERRRVRKALKEWQAGMAHLTEHGEGSDSASIKKLMKTFDANVSMAHTYLEQARELVQEEVDQNIALAYDARSRLRVRMLAVIAVLFGLGLLTALVMYGRTSRAVRLHVRDITEGVKRFAEGDFGHRIYVGERDELGEVAACFNEMGDTLEHSSRALVEMSMRDKVTGLYNRGEFLQILRSERERGRRYKRPFSIMVVRFENWAQINRDHGQTAADAALATVGAAVRAAVRDTDRVGRWKEDEFGLIMTEVAKDGGLVVARKLKDLIASLDIEDSSGKPVVFLVSTGVSEYVQDLSTDESLVQAAEDAIER